MNSVNSENSHTCLQAVKTILIFNSFLKITFVPIVTCILLVFTCHLLYCHIICLAGVL